MKDEEFIERFEDCSLPNESFHHQDHVKLAWLYLRRYPELEALARFTQGLKNFARHHGKPGRYHETITWAYIFLIHERMVRADREQTWQEFAAANEDLLDWRDGVLKNYYREETLRSERARQTFMFPDRWVLAK